MKKSNWRIPNDDEKNQVLYWIKRNRNQNISFALCCLGFPLTLTIAFVVASYYIEPENLIKGRPVILMVGFFLIFIGLFNVYNIITETEKVRLVSSGEFEIIDAKVQFVGQKSLGRYAYTNVVEASFHSGFGAKPTTFSVSRAIMKKTKAGGMGCVIIFPKGNIWTRKSLVFIPRD